MTKAVCVKKNGIFIFFRNRHGYDIFQLSHWVRSRFALRESQPCFSECRPKNRPSLPIHSGEANSVSKSVYTRNVLFNVYEEIANVVQMRTYALAKRLCDENTSQDCRHLLTFLSLRRFPYPNGANGILYLVPTEFSTAVAFMAAHLQWKGASRYGNSPRSSSLQGFTPAHYTFETYRCTPCEDS